MGLESRVPSKVITVEEQKRQVRASTTEAGFNTTNLPFEFDRRWQREIVHQAQQQPPEYLQLTGLLSRLSAQYGYDSIAGFSYLHKRVRHWEKEVTDPMHIVADLLYVAHRNTVVHPIKQEIFDRLFSEGAEDAAYGAWGLFLKTHRGKIDPLGESAPNLPIKEVKKAALLRFDSDRQISLPDTDVNGRLSQIPFDGGAADKMPLSEFNETVLPQVAAAIQEYLDPRSIFDPERTFLPRNIHVPLVPTHVKP